MNHKFLYLLLLLLIFTGLCESTEIKLSSLGDCDIVISDETNQINLWWFSNKPARLYWNSSREYTYNKFLGDSQSSKGDDSKFLTYSGTLGYFYPFGNRSAFTTEIGISNSELVTGNEKEDLGKGNLVLVGYNIILQKFLSVGVSGKYSVQNSIDFIDSLQITSTCINWNIGLAFQLGDYFQLGFSVFPSYISYENQYLEDISEFKLNGENFGSSLNIIGKQGEDIQFGLNLSTESNDISPEAEIDLESILPETVLYSTLNKRSFKFQLKHEMLDKSITYGFTALLESKSEERRNKADDYLYNQDNTLVEFGLGLLINPRDFILICSEYYSFEEREEDLISGTSLKNLGSRQKYGMEIRIFKRYYLRGGYVFSDSEHSQDKKSTYGIGYHEGTKTIVDLFYTYEEIHYINGEDKRIINSRFGFSSRINF